MEIFLCVTIAALAAAYFLRAALRPASPAFLPKGILPRDRLGYMLSMLAFTSKKAERGNGLSPKSAYRLLKRAYRMIGKKQPDARFLCEKTLYDNFYAVDMLSGTFTRALPHVSRMPRIYAFCELFVKSTGGVVTREALARAVRTYSAETPLCFRELAALEPVLKIALCEYLAIYAKKLIRINENVERGEADGRKKRVCYPLLRSAAYVFGYRKVNAAPFAEARFSPDAERERQNDFIEKLAKYNARITAATQSLHALAGVFSHDLVLSLCEADGVLSAGDETYGKLSSATRYLYLSRIGKEAAKRKCGEAGFAREVLLKAAKEGKDISFFLLPHAKGKGAARAYAGINVVLWLAAAVMLIAFFSLRGLVVALVGLPIFVQIASAVCRKVIGCFAWRRQLPAYDEKALSVGEHATAILMPCYASSVGDIEDCFSRFTAVMALNRDPVFSYCLLFDYPQSKGVEDERDGALTAAIQRLFAELPPEQRVRTCVLVRKRARVKQDDIYRGYEKKRGAVMDFAAYVLRGEGEFAVKLGDIRGVKYAVTLDSDTATYDCAALVAAKAHPYSQDVAVLTLNCKAAEKRTPFARLFGGETGPGLYRQKAFEPYNDVFGVGNYTGKGIFDIALFDARL
ncbi:MAG: hypothetical protein K2M95_07025, partial [Clostridiales bacterium]|nr:hypothetical protein [Clostridiales bacterium]